MRTRLFHCSLALAMFAGPSAAQERRWVAETIARAGTPDGPAALADVFDLEVGPGGEILAGQPRIGTIAIFAADGAYLRSVGRRGQGPGEFTVLGGMGWLADTLWAVDFNRLHLFDADLRFVRTVVPQPDAAPAGVQLLVGPIMADGTLLRFPVMTRDGSPAPIQRISAAGDLLGTLARVSDRGQSVGFQFEDRNVSLPNPWTDHPLWLNAEDGRSIVMVNRRVADEPGEASFEVLRIGLDGDTLVHERIAYTPRAVTDDDVEQAYVRPTRFLANRVSVTEARALREVRDRLPPPRFHVPVLELVRGRNGTIWLRRDDAAADSAEWQVLDASAHPLARLRLPAGLRVFRAQADRLWCVERDSLDVPYIRVLAVKDAGS